MATFRERLEQALSMRDISPAELSKRTKIGEGAISQYRKGAYQATQKNLEKIALALNVPIPWLMGASDDFNVSLPSNIIPMPKTYKVPLIGTIACGQPILAIEENDEVVEVPENVKADFALRCEGDSMINARIFDGDIVYIRKQPEVETGEIAAVRIGDEATLKRVRLYPDKIILEPANPMYDPLVYRGEELNDIEILGKAVAFTSMVR